MIKLITFKTNHTVIADLSKKDDVIILTKPVQVIMQPTENGPAVGFAPFLEYSKEFEKGITFHSEDVLCITSPVVELENEYNKHFGSGIQLVTNGL